MLEITLKVHSVGKGVDSLTGEDSSGVTVSCDGVFTERFFGWASLEKLLLMKQEALKGKRK